AAGGGAERGRQVHAAGRPRRPPATGTRHRLAPRRPTRRPAAAGRKVPPSTVDLPADLRRPGPHRRTPGRAGAGGAARRRPPGGAAEHRPRRRLALALLVADPPDLLLLDEPTNHISLTLAEELEEALHAAPGGVVVATHDRWLRRRWEGPAVEMAPPAVSWPAVLEVEGLRKRYGDKVALDGVSFTVPPGVMFGFVGANGAGKTTTMRIIMGVTRADGGDVRWRGSGLDLSTRRRFGYLPEERGLYPSMRVSEQIEYFGRLHGMSAADARRAAQHWIERLDLGRHRGDEVNSLSLGNQQRVQLAVAVVHNPQLLVLDEPFSGLDPLAVETLARS